MRQNNQTLSYKRRREDWLTEQDDTYAEYTCFSIAHASVFGTEIKPFWFALLTLGKLEAAKPLSFDTRARQQ